MGIPQRPVHGLADPNHLRRDRETTNDILTFRFDDSRIRTAAEIAAGVTPVNYAYVVENVRRQGAVGDGVADDSAAVQRAVNVAFATIGSGAAGVAIYFPCGSYRIVTPPVFPTSSNIRPLIIYGDGLGSQIISESSANKPLFDMLGVNGWTIRDLLICGSSASPNDGIRAGLTGGTQGIAWHIENVLSMMAGKGIVVTDSNTGTITNFHHWPLSTSGLLRIALTVDPGFIDHGIYLTGGFVHNVSIYDAWCQANINYTSGMRGIKMDCTNSAGVVILGGLFQSANGGGGTETSIEIAPTGSATEMRIGGMYVEGASILLKNFIRGIVGPITNGAAGSTLTLTSAVRNSLFFGLSFDAINDASSSNYGNTFFGVSAASSWTDTSGSGANPPDRRINCLSVGALVNDWGGGQAFTLTYSTSMTPDAYNGLQQRIVANNGTAFTINAPLHPIIGQRLRIQIYNTSGGALGAVTWNAVYKMSAWTQPANGFNRSIEFYYDSVFWCQVSQTGVDVPN